MSHSAMSKPLIACSTLPPRPCQNVDCRSFSVTRSGSTADSPSSSGHNSWYSESDDKTKIFYPEVIIENNESQTFTGNEVRLVCFADDMRYKGQMKVVSVSNTKADFKERAETVLKPEAFRLRHYEYNSRYSNYEYEHGYKYSGYAFTIKNSEGEVMYQEATKPYLLNPKLFFECKTDQLYDDKFERKLNSSSSSSSTYAR